MADTKISDLPSVVSLSGSELIPVVKLGSTQKATPDQIRTFLGVYGSNTGDQDLSGLALKTTTVNGHPLSANVTVTASDVGLGNVENTSDANKPISIATAGALTGKQSASDLTNASDPAKGAALVGYLQTGTGAVGRTVKAKLQDVISVKDYGAVGNGIADDTAEIQAAIDANPGKRIFVPNGIYNISGLMITTSSTVLFGDGNSTTGSVLRPTNLTGNDVTISGCQFAGIENICFWPVVKKTSGYAVYFTGGNFRGRARDINIVNGFNGIGVVSATETVVTNCQCRQMLGVIGVNFSGTVSSGSYRLTIDNFGADNPYPEALGTVKTYAALTEFTLGQVTLVNNVIWQCSQAGTTGAASSPSGYPGATAQTVFTAELTDGTVKWKFVADSNLNWIVQDNYAYSLVIDKAACLNGARGYLMRDTAATGSSYPMWTFAWDLETDHSFAVGVQANEGEGLYIDGSWIGSCLNGNGVLINTGHRGEVYIGAGTRIMGHAESGVFISPGPKTISIDSCNIGLNGQKASNTYHGIVVEGGVTDFSITNNRIGNFGGYTGNQQYAGIFLVAGATDQFTITGNNLLNNVTTALIDASTGLVKNINNNLGVTTNKIVGSLDISSSTGGQIVFPATQNPSSNANTLDDYKEGTWTPVLTFATPGNLAVSYAAQSAGYTKIGRLVTAKFFIQTSAFTHTTASGDLIITGLPFTSENTIESYGALNFSGITKATYTDFVAAVLVNTQNIVVRASGSGVGVAAVTAANMPTGGTVVLRGTITYTV